MSDPVELAARWAEWKAEHPRGRIRNAAEALGVSEAALLATTVGEGGAVRLRPEGIRPILRAGHTLGEVMVLTRNPYAVHEKVGPYDQIDIGQGPVGLAVGEAIDLRLFLGRWAHAFATRVDHPKGPLPCFQFFDAEGTAIHKIYVRQAERHAAWQALVEEWRADDQGQGFVAQPLPAPKAPRPDSEIDVQALRADWAALKDTHDFFPMIRRHKVERRQALRLVGAPFAERVAPDALTRTLHAAAEGDVPIMVFVGNPGCLQIHTGPVKRVRPMGPWINVLDPGFNLHARADQITEVWRVIKPTEDGDVTALECYAPDGSMAVQLFGARKPGKAELPEWRALAHTMPPTSAAA